MTVNFDFAALLEPECWQEVLAMGTPQTFERGELIFKDRSLGEYFYLIDHGPVEILKDTSQGQEVRLAILEDGSILGERSLFGDGTRTATARAFASVTLIAIKASDLKAYLDAHPAFALQFYKALCEKFTQMIRDLDDDVRSLYYRLSFT